MTLFNVLTNSMTARNIALLCASVSIVSLWQTAFATPLVISNSTFSPQASPNLTNMSIISATTPTPIHSDLNRASKLDISVPEEGHVVSSPPYVSSFYDYGALFVPRAQLLYETHKIVTMLQYEMERQGADTQILTNKFGDQFVMQIQSPTSFPSPLDNTTSKSGSQNSDKDTKPSASTSPPTFSISTNTTMNSRNILVIYHIKGFQNRLMTIGDAYRAMTMVEWFVSLWRPSNMVPHFHFHFYRADIEPWDFCLGFMDLHLLQSGEEHLSGGGAVSSSGVSSAGQGAEGGEDDSATSRV